jgi:hypothetical protein
VISIYPNVSNFAFDRDLYNQEITPLRPGIGEPLMIMWTHTFDTHLDRSWTPNHFVPCLEVDEEPGLETPSTISVDKVEDQTAARSNDTETKQCKPGEVTCSATQPEDRKKKKHFKIKFKFPWSKKKVKGCEK